MRVARRSLASAAALALAVLVAAPAAPASAQTTPAGGFADAAGIIVNLEVLGAIELPGVIEDTPIDPNTFARASQSCPPQEDKPAEGTLINVPAAPAATAQTVTAMAGANCAEPVAVASAQTEDLAALINAGVPVITADVIRAQANSNCVDAPNGEGSIFAGLTIAGQAISETPDPNTRIDLPVVGVTVIVNEQRPTADGRGIVVNGLHIIGDGTLVRGDLVISHAVSGVVCPNGKGSEIAEGLEAPEITFDKDATPSTAQAGDTVTYNATVTNTSEEPCDVIRFVDHLSPVFELVSTSGGFGDTAVDPAPVRSDGGQDVVIDPTDVTIDAGASVQQTIVVKLKGDVQPGTYFNTLEIFCATNGNFASGPLAPVTVPAAAVAEQPAAAPPAEAPAQLPRTGAAPLLALTALVLIGGSVGARRLARR
jgi:uncharacterized repeat protein (TIGR01451 family)